jgi:hypothetical protein
MVRTYYNRSLGRLNLLDFLLPRNSLVDGQLEPRIKTDERPHLFFVDTTIEGANPSARARSNGTWDQNTASSQAFNRFGVGGFASAAPTPAGKLLAGGAQTPDPQLVPWWYYFELSTIYFQTAGPWTPDRTRGSTNLAKAQLKSPCRTRFMKAKGNYLSYMTSFYKVLQSQKYFVKMKLVGVEVEIQMKEKEKFRFANESAWKLSKIWKS